MGETKKRTSPRNAPPQLVQPTGLPSAPRFGSSIEVRNGGTLKTVQRSVSDQTSLEQPRPRASYARSQPKTKRMRDQRDALLFRLHEQVLQVEERLLRRLHVDKRRRDTRLARTTRTTTLMGIVLSNDSHPSQYMLTEGARRKARIRNKSSIPPERATAWHKTQRRHGRTYFNLLRHRVVDDVLDL